MNDDYTVTYICPKCDQVITVNGLRYRGIEGVVDIHRQCECGNLYTATLERRLYYRQQTDLTAVYSIKDSSVKKNTRIKDVSQCGFKLEITDDQLQIGDCLTVEFYSPNDMNNKLTTKEVIVRNRNKNSIGVEFCSTDISGIYINYGNDL